MVCVDLPSYFKFIDPSRTYDHCTFYIVFYRVSESQDLDNKVFICTYFIKFISFSLASFSENSRYLNVNFCSYNTECVRTKVYELMPRPDPGKVVMTQDDDDDFSSLHFE